MEILEKVPDRYLGLLDEGDNYMSIWLCAEIIKLSGDWEWGRYTKKRWLVINRLKKEGRIWPIVYEIGINTFSLKVKVGYIGENFSPKSPQVPIEVHQIHKDVIKLKMMIGREQIVNETIRV
jgi:hypothetical protein